MFTPLPMQHVTLHFLGDDAVAAALTLAELGAFNPDAAALSGHSLPDRPGQHYQELYRNARMRLDKAIGHLDLHPDAHPNGPSRVITLTELEQLNDWLGEIWHKCSECEERQRRVAEEEHLVQQLEDALKNYAALNVNLGLLQGNLQFLDVRVGTVPIANVKRLSEAVGLAGYILETFMVSDSQAHVVLAGLAGSQAEIEPVLEAANYRAVRLPPEFRDYPDKVRTDLDVRRRQAVAMREAHMAEIEHHRAEHGEQLLAAAETLRLAGPYAELADSLRSSGALNVVTGWVPRDDVQPLHAALEARLGNRFVMDSRAPTAAERSVVPSAVRYPRWLSGFSALIKNYGIPRYGEFDPTWLFALTFVAMFGMMFGDIGHGAVIAGAGLWFRGRLGRFTPFVVALGLSSILFGFLYGSIFGYEHVIHPVWMSPLSDPNRMLLMALMWGIGFILVATLITIRNRLVEGRLREALLDGKGLAGAILYIGMIYGAYRGAVVGQFDLVEKLLIVVPLAVILTHHWLKVRASAGEKVLVVFMEGFETLVGYIANTLSFLRVAAFSLNHVALAVAVFTLAAMMDTMGHWVTVVLGNLFILVLEGAIVAIQVLRLEYYEGFSRYFSGDGREFRPLRLVAYRS